MDKDTLTKDLRKLFVEEDNISETQAAKLIGMAQSNFNKKLNAGTLRYLEIYDLLDKLGYDIIWKKRS